MTSPLVAAGACALGAALVIGAATDPAVLLAAVLLAQAVVVLGWHRLLDVPGAVGGKVVAGAAALGADVLVVVDAGEDRPLAAVPAVLAMAVLAGLVHQLARQGGRDRLTASLTATVSLVALASLGSTFLAVSEAEDGLGLVSASAAAAGLVVAGVWLRRWRGGSHRHDIAVVAVAGAAATLAVVALDGLPLVPALAVAGSAGVLAWVATVLLSRAPAAGAQPGGLLVAGPAAGLPLLVAGPAGYVLGSLLVG